MTTNATRRVALQPNLATKLLQRDLRLRDFDRAEPRLGSVENVFDSVRSFGEPSIIVGVAVPFDATNAAEDSMESPKDLSRDPDLSMLGC